MSSHNHLYHIKADDTNDEDDADDESGKGENETILSLNNYFCQDFLKVLERLNKYSNNHCN